MNQKELKELIEFLVEKDIAEFELEHGDMKVRIKRGDQTAAPAEPRIMAPVLSGLIPTLQHIPQVAPPSAIAPAVPAAKPAEEEGLHIVKSPIVGTYYESPSTGSPPFVKEGDTIT